MGALEHFGMPRRSGRYPWGSGKDPDPSSPRGRKRESESVQTAKKILSDKSEFDKMSTKDLQDLVARVGLESSLRNTLAKNQAESRSVVNKAMRKLGGAAIGAVSKYAEKLIQDKITEYLSGKKGAGQAVNEAAKKAKEAASSGKSKQNKTVNETIDMMNNSGVWEASSQAVTALMKIYDDNDAYRRR